VTPLRWVGAGVGALLLILFGFVLWVLNSQSGAVFVANRATRLLQGKLAIGSVQGTIAGPLMVSGVRYRDLEKGVDVLVESASIDVALKELLSRRVHVLEAKVGGVVVRLTKPTKPPEEDNEPFSLKPPIDIVVDRFTLQGANISKDGKPLVAATRALLVGSWTGRGVGIRQLEVESPQGKVGISGSVARNAAYVGQASGHFRWRQGELEYAGALNLDSTPREVKVDVRLTSPMDARVTAAAEQKKAVPWHVDVRVPTFDPRKKLMPDSSLKSLFVALRGDGDLQRAEVKGEVAVNGARVLIDPARIAMADQVIHIEALTLRDPEHRGILDVDGSVRLDKKPFYADVIAKWREVQLPPQLVGQKLDTQGELKIRGNTSEFDARGDLTVGPPGKPANLSLIALGTPEVITLERFSIVQKQGDLTAMGRIGLKPRMSWKVSAEAKQFDPGALLAGWNGRLGFKLASEGQIEEAGPSATLTLQQLAGTLRERALAGDADLKLSPNKVVAGTANLKSGGSTIRVTGAGGQTLDLTGQFNVATLEDWVPDSRGQITGGVTVKGTWPKIAIRGNARGQGLSFTDVAARSVTVDVDITEPLHPHGSLNVKGEGLGAKDFEFNTITLQANGSDTDHTVEMNAEGNPLGAALRLKGQRLEKGWAGTVETLRLTVPKIEQLTLREPVRIRYEDVAFEISESCLANSQLSVCAAAQRTANEELQAHYAIERLPLALIMSIAQPDFPYVVTGEIEGKGDVRRTADGALFGAATLQSASGNVAEENAESDPLLSYQNFQLNADLNGDTAHGTAQMAFNNGGNIQGEATLAQLRAAAPTIQAHGSLSIGDLSPIGLFVTQLANIKGRAQGEISVSGTLSEPAVSGNGQVREFAAELPLLGLQLKDGNVDVTASGAGAIKLNGQITSGNGQLTFDGEGPSIADLHIRAAGKEVLAANIPAANVVVAPNLDFTRKDDRMELTGKVQVASAHVDLTKLPRTNNAVQASPDVVVVDDPRPANAERAKAMQLFTEVTIEIGNKEKVTLVGFGLDAKLGGQLLVRESPGSDPLGVGEIRVEGTYKAYGQDLTIERGRLSYANTPLSDPQVDIVAYREIEEVTARLTVRGSAKQPILEVSSDPPMPQTAALSYLVTGKPLDQLGTGGSGEGDLMQSAARSLGGAAGNLIAKNLGKRFGIDQIGVENSTEIGGSAFTVGEYLSPRLYISYGVGLFEPGQVVTLRYRLSRAVNVEASQGPRSQRAGINYKVEKR
jgi:translocation and assembly module TamB